MFGSGILAFYYLFNLFTSDPIDTVADRTKVSGKGNASQSITLVLQHLVMKNITSNDSKGATDGITIIGSNCINIKLDSTDTTALSDMFIHVCEITDSIGIDRQCNSLD